MEKRIAPTFASFIFFITLFLYAAYFETGDNESNGAWMPTQVLSFKFDDLRYISWIINGELEQKVEIDPVQSKLVYPYEVSADQTEVEGILSYFHSLKSEMVIEDPMGLETYGIASGSPSVVIETLQEKIQLTLGDKAAIGNSYYLKLSDDEKLYMVSSFIIGVFSKTLSDLRSRALFEKNLTSITNIRIDSKTADFIELLLSDNKWIIEKPSKMFAEEESVNNLINNIKNLKISSFLDADSPDNYNLKTPLHTYTLTSESGAVTGLQILAFAQNRAIVKLIGEPRIYAIQALDIEKLAKNINDLRAKTFGPVSLDELKEIVFVDSSGEFFLKKQNSSWFIQNNQIDDTYLATFIDDFNSNPIYDFLPVAVSDAHFDYNNTKVFRFITQHDESEYVLGNKQEATLSLFNKDEIFLVSSELDESFNKLISTLKETSHLVQTEKQVPDSQPDDLDTVESD